MAETAKTPLRMTAREFVTCLAVMAAAGKPQRKIPRRPRGRSRDYTRSTCKRPEQLSK
jgi:hypothetical protein